MANYMKSEFYRILHEKTIYLLTFVIMGLAVFVNVVLYLFSTLTPQFRYGTVRFVFGLLITDMQFFYIGALLVVMFLSSDEYKNGVLKNAVAGGIGRTQIFLGKCIVYGLTAAGSAAVILAGFIVSAQILLGGNSATPLDSVYPLQMMLTGTVANLPFTLASVVLTVTLCQFFQKESQVSILWLTVISLIPMTVRMLGYKIPICARIAEWMPWNFMITQVKVMFSDPQMEALWMHPQGFLKCIIVGVIGIVLFGAAGIIGFRKKDIP